MKDFAEFIVKRIVSQPDKVVIEELVDNTFVTITITVAKEDMGLLIGKHGATIESVRELLKAKAVKDGVKIEVKLNDSL